MLWFVWSIFALAQGFNLDTKSPVIFKSDNPGDYFGFSVALHRNRDGPMALVGAPRANSTTFEDLHQPGVLYKCQVDKSHLPCQEIILDTKGNSVTTTKDDNFNYMDKKDDMWLGVSLDIQRNSNRNDIVTCGHLWKNQLYNNHYLANGACYVVNEDLDQNGVAKLVPFVDKSKQSLHPGIYKFAMGQMGTSAAFSEDGKYLLLGAPGYYDWTGTVASYALNSEKRESYKYLAVPSPAVDRTRTPQSYIGYSVTSGKFYNDGEDYVAVGAPRDGDFHGRVYIYKAVKSGEEKLVVHRKKEGIQFGEYFGAAVLGMDLNGDGYTDLLVGSPLFSIDSIVDKGKVYVFMSNKLGLQMHAELYSKTKTSARFGTALANAGDLNQDGFNDFVIGAPYEDGNGAIYIYHGSETGMNDQYVQRIAAAEIDSSLAGFGIQISRGYDIDVNQYPDILVGSYASSNAVLFRSQPVVKLFPQITFSPNQINTAVTNCVYQEQSLACVNVTVCLWYAGKHVPLHLEFQHDVFVELTNQVNLVTPRGFFVSNGKSTYSIHQKSVLDVGVNSCFRDLLYIRNSTKDVITPIQLLYRYNLLGSSNTFNKSHPIMDPLSTSNVTSLVTFQTGCGSDNRCLSDLRVSATILGQTNQTAPLIIGRNSTLSLSIKVDNKGEPAFLSELLINLPAELPSISIKCSEPSEKQSERNVSFICDLGNLAQNQTAEILVKLDLDKIPTNKKKLYVNLTVRTASDDINLKDNHTLNFPLYFEAKADISITGSPAQEQIRYDGKTEEKLSIPISHTYFVMNHGPSPVEIIDIRLWIPISFEGKDGVADFVTFTNLEIDSGLTIAAECNDTYLDIKPGLPDVPNVPDGVFNFSDLVPQSSNNNNEKVFSTSEKTTSLDYSISDTEASVPSRFRRSSEKRSARKRKDVSINCEEAKCMLIECSASRFIETRQFAKITVSLLVNMSVINDNVEPWFRVEFVTKGEVTVRNDSNGLSSKKNGHPDKTEVKTVIVSTSIPPSEEVDQWIIFVSIGIGILLLLIILALLIKFGFFKREQKEKMEKMKSKADCKDYETCEGESTESEALN